MGASCSKSKPSPSLLGPKTPSVFHSVERVKEQIALGAPVNERSIFEDGVIKMENVTPLHLALYNNGQSPSLIVEIVRVLVLAGADVNASMRVGWNFGVRPIHQAVELRSPSLVDALCTGPIRIDINAGRKDQLSESTSALHMATHLGDVAIINKLLSYGANVNAKMSPTLATPLHLALNSAQSLSIFQALINIGKADLNQVVHSITEIDQKGGNMREYADMTVTHLAVLKQRFDVVRMLLSSGDFILPAHSLRFRARIDHKSKWNEWEKQSLLALLVERTRSVEDVHLVEELCAIDPKAISHIDRKDSEPTALHIAAAKKNIPLGQSLIWTLLKLGADPNQFWQGKRVLDTVSNESIAILLMKAGAIDTRRAWTALASRLLKTSYTESSSIVRTNADVQKFDVFLSHDWGIENANHARVKLVNEALKKRGLVTWLDEEQFRENLLQEMALGITNSTAVLAFLTKRYQEKVASGDSADACKLEFEFAAKNKRGNIIPIVFDEEMREQTSWIGPVGLILGSALWVDLSSISLDHTNHTELNSSLNATIDDLVKRIRSRGPL